MTREQVFNDYMRRFRSQLHPIVDREHFRVIDLTEHKTYYTGSQSEAEDIYSHIINYGNNVTYYYKEA